MHLVNQIHVSLFIYSPLLNFHTSEIEKLKAFCCVFCVQMVILRQPVSHVGIVYYVETLISFDCMGCYLL